MLGEGETKGGKRTREGREKRGMYQARALCQFSEVSCTTHKLRGTRISCFVACPHPRTWRVSRNRGLERVAEIQERSMKRVPFRTNSRTRVSCTNNRMR